ncbi:MAG: 2-oxo acid dehydrogenase subunit E2 [Thermoleophilia bacterium]|nr:2-oxo acid dehydrogenase subunit E2 [Thermoleophilia bacterium]
MATEVTLPRLGQGMESGTIVRWLKAEGDEVAQDEPLYELDTEKVTQEVESPATGVLLRIVAPEGSEVPVGAPICVIGAVGEEVVVSASPAPAAQAPAAAPAAPAAAPAAPAAEAPKVEAAPDGRVKASPLARRMAKERGVDLAAVVGTGPDGRVVAEDVERAAAGEAPAAAPVPAATPAVAPVPAPAEAETVKLSRVRRTIARRLSEAWQAPHFAVSMTADMSRVVQLRETLVARTPEGAARPTYSDILTKVCAVALLRHPALNAHYVDGEIRRFPTANVGMAVAIPDGLVVPVLRGVEAQTVPALAAARQELVARTRAGELTPADVDGGTFTISNLGMYGVERFFAVLNPPQVAILAAGAIGDHPVVEAGEVVVRPRMEMTLSCDHRAVDGATASEFLRTVRELLEEPGLAL